MAEFKIVTDSNSDLPQEYLEQNNIGVLYLSYTICEQVYDEFQKLDIKEFYRLMRNGNMSTTSQVNPTQAKDKFEEYLNENNELLYIAFSSGLSGTCGSGQIAAQEIMEENPNAKIIVVDSLCASLGQGLLIHLALQKKKEGKTIEEVAAYLEDIKLNLVHIFTVDDLNHLYRGGRVSHATAIIGSLANIKPILHVDNEGHLIPINKVRGRKKSLHALVDYMEQKMTEEFMDKNPDIFISHGDCLEDVELLKEEIVKRFGERNFLINEVGPTVGAHSGPGTMALFFLGTGR